MKLIPINQRLASKLVDENPKLTGEIVEIRTIFKDENGKALFEMTRSVHGDKEMLSYAMYMPEYNSEV